MSTGEKRHHPRLTLRHTRIRNGLLVGRVINMSLSGLALESSTGLRIGSRYTFRMVLREHPFTIKGEVRWCRLTRTVEKRPGEVVPIFRAGLAFNRPLELFSEGGLQNSEQWFDPEFRVSR
jgi:hypothetical protein